MMWLLLLLVPVVLFALAVLAVWAHGRCMRDAMLDVLAYVTGRV